MEAEKQYFRTILFTVLLFALVQTSCNSQNIVKPTVIPTLIKTETPEPINTLIPTSSPIAAASLTQILTVDAAHQTWRATAVAIQTEERAASVQSWNKKKDQVAQFPSTSSTCEDTNLNLSNISPDGKWLATSCGYKENQTLIVQNKNGTKWVLNFNDFLRRPKDIEGSLRPKFWGSEGNYLFFTIGLGYSGGGNYCFPEDRGDYGLFRLNLSNGSWSTVIPFTDSFPGYEIKFSPTGRRYAITLNGVLIVDLQTGKSTEITSNKTTERLSWSTDGKYLAYSLANCDDEKIISSSLYIWDAATNQTQILFKMDGIILKPESWMDNSTIRITGQEFSNLQPFYTIFKYNIKSKKILFTETATPRP